MNLPFGCQNAGRIARSRAVKKPVFDVQLNTFTTASHSQVARACRETCNSIENQLRSAESHTRCQVCTICLTSALFLMLCPIGFVLDSATMPQFVIEREIAGAGKLSEAELREVSLRSLSVLNQMGPQIQWLHSYVTEDKVYCVYLAPDEDTIREHARRTGIPADRVSAVRRLIEASQVN